MRRLVVTALSLLLPFAAWMAGCRQEQAAFPGGPEMKALAANPGARPGGYKEAPFIPAAIDPEVLAIPDQGTFSRIQAVMDREAQLASRQAGPGLFVMPRQEFPELAQYEPLPEPVPVAGQPLMAAGTTTEFWSRPAELLVPSAQPVPADVSAMMPAARPAEPLMAPETIPGIYMGLGAVETFSAAPVPAAPAITAPVMPVGAPVPAPVFAAPESAPTAYSEAHGGWEDNRRPPFPAGGLNPGGMSPPPSLSLVETRAIPLSLDWSPTVASTRLKELFERQSIADLLAPLPRLDTPRRVPSLKEAAQSVLNRLELAGAITDLEPLDDASLDKTARGLTHMGGLFLPVPDEPAAPSERELYMMDFWLDKPTAAAKPESAETAVQAPPAPEAPKAPIEVGTEVVAVTPLETGKPAESAQPVESLRPPGDAAPRKKVTLREGRGGRRKAAFADIDSRVTSPPLKF